MNYTFSGFSKAGNAVVRGAIAAAQDMGHTYVGTEHLLLALLEETGSAAMLLLADLGVDAVRLAGDSSFDHWLWPTL